MRITNKDISRFYKNVSFGFGRNACWSWMGGINLKTGRGRFWVNGDTRSAPTVSFLIHKGEIPENMFVCHHCDNPNCVNPFHLFSGTNSDNQKDLYSKGLRDVKGTNAPGCKISSDTVISIRELYKSGEYTQRQLASLYGVHQSTVHQITTRKSFKNL